ncbi:hypothetical protein D3C76_1431410 [compost metagenome]
MATAATPLSDKPTNARVTSTPSQDGIKALATVLRAAHNKAATITGLRPIRSEMGPVMSKPIASIAVDMDRIRLLWAALMENSCDSIGIIGCTQYNNAKVAKPPQNNASTVRMNNGVPRSMNCSREGSLDTVPSGAG